jgi:hypothetical protein
MSPSTLIIIPTYGDGAGGTKRTHSAFFVHVPVQGSAFVRRLHHCGTLCSLRLARQMLNQSASLFWLLELKFQVQVTCVASRNL